jgi:hypothetical protein
VSQVSLVTYALLAPFCALEPNAEDSRIHALTMEGIVGVMAGKDSVSPCGRPVKLFSVPLESEEAIPWPVSTRGLPKPFTRCRECWAATGQKRPASHFVKRLQEAPA